MQTTKPLVRILARSCRSSCREFFSVIHFYAPSHRHTVDRRVRTRSVSKTSVLIKFVLIPSVVLTARKEIGFSFASLLSTRRTTAIRSSLSTTFDHRQLLTNRPLARDRTRRPVNSFNWPPAFDSSISPIVLIAKMVAGLGNLLNALFLFRK